MMNLWEKIVDFLIQTIGHYAVDSWRESSSVDRDISDLRSAVRKAHLLIERSECWRLPLNGPIDKLLPQLKEAVYEAETVVHEFVYQNLKNEVEKSSSGTIFLKNWMNDFPSVVKTAIDEIDKISKEMKETCDIGNIPENPNEFSKTARPITSTFPSTTTVYGREQELIKILNLMGVPISGKRNTSRNENVSNLDAGESSQCTNQEGNFSILSIVGMGGVGKTTFAQMVCNNKRVKSYFDPIMWVCVSDNFDLVKLTTEIMESATKKGYDLTNLNVLQENLQAKLNAKRFLLVLDDVWSKDWQRLLGPMKRAREGSIVMVTTRSHECVEFSDTGICSRGVVNLEGLEENIYWEFFKSRAFDSVAISNVGSELEAIGKEICGRLKGSPLAAKTIGGLLRANNDVTHWMTIKNSAMWQLCREESDILPVLQLSYQYLPSHLKKCFSYCALYPKDFKYTKWELTKLWVMQGFINVPEQVKVYWKEPFIKEAEENFHELVQRCFFQKAAGSRLGEYVIHDLMHDVCQSITKDECFCLEYRDWEKSIKERNIRHLSIFRKRMKEKEQERLCKYEKLLSVRLGPWRNCHINAIDKWCETLTNIRSLSLSKCKINKLPESIGNLKHLQYLDISFTKIEKLPGSFCDLYNLVYLNMEDCSQIESVPEGFSRLVNLRFLYWLPNKLILLGHVQNFATTIEVENVQLAVCFNTKIENLKYMDKLTGRLTITKLENVSSKKAAEEAQLKNKPLINQLYLIWSEIKDHSRLSLVEKPQDDEVLEGLRPHPNIKVLKIDTYGGETLPSWFIKIFLPNLTEIYLKDCKRLRDLHCLRPLYFPLLKIINITSCYELVSLPVESFGEFPSLKDLTISKCAKLTCSNDMVLPPSIETLLLESCGGLEKSIPTCLQDLISLGRLHIKHCPGLVSIPAKIISNLKSLFWLHIEGCVELQSLGGLRFLDSLKVLEIKKCPKLTFSDAIVLPPFIETLWLESFGGLENSVTSCLQNLSSLKRLHIEECAGLVSIPTEITRNLTSLRWLCIKDCAELQSLEGRIFLTSLEECHIEGCPKLAETRGQHEFGKPPPELLSKLPSTSRRRKRGAGLDYSSEVNPSTENSAVKRSKRIKFKPIWHDDFNFR